MLARCPHHLSLPLSLLSPLPHPWSPAARQNHTASLTNVQPKGCLKSVINATTGGDAALAEMITPECFNKLSLALTNHTGAAGCTPRIFKGVCELGAGCRRPRPLCFGLGDACAA